MVTELVPGAQVAGQSALQLPIGEFIAPLDRDSDTDRTRLEVEVRRQLEAEILEPMRVSLDKSGFVTTGNTAARLLPNLAAVPSHYYHIIARIRTMGRSLKCPPGPRRRTQPRGGLVKTFARAE